MAAKGIRAGRAFVELFADDSKLVRGLRGAQRRMRAFASSVTNMGAKLLGLGSAVAAPMGVAIKAASDLEETMNKFRVVFGDNAGAVQAWGDEFAKQVGRSRTQVAGFLSGSQDLLVPVGVDPKTATAMSKQLTRLAVDLASFNNLADDAVMRDLQAALTGSSETMKKYGVLTSVAAVKQELLNQGLDPKTATEAQKVQARLAIMLRDTSAAQGDAVRSAGSFANRMKALQARATDAAATFGSQLLPAITPLVDTVVGAVAATGRWIEANPQLAATILRVTAAVAGAGVALIAMGAAASAISVGIGILGTVLTTLGAVLGTILTPFGLITAALAGGVYAFARWTETGRAAVAYLGESFGPLVGQVQESIGLIVKAVSQGKLQAAFQFAATAIGIIWEGLMAELWVQFKLFLANAIKGLAKLVKHIMNLPHKALGMEDHNFKNSSALFAAARALEPNRGETLTTTVGGKKVGEFSTTPEAKAAADRQKRMADAMDKLRAVLADPKPVPVKEGPKVGGPGQGQFSVPPVEVVKAPDTSSVRSSAAGTFNPFAVRGFGGGVQERIAKATEETAKHTKRLVSGGGGIAGAIRFGA